MDEITPPAKKRPARKRAAKKRAPAKKKAAKRKPGRPRKKIDEKAVEQLAAYQCTLEEIANFVGCSIDTLQRRFAVQIEKGRCACKIKLRRAQIQKAMAGNTAMLIFLGKQMLGQSDKIDQRSELTGPGGQPLGESGPMVQVMIDGAAWDPSRHGAIEAATEDDIPEKV